MEAPSRVIQILSAGQSWIGAHPWILPLAGSFSLLTFFGTLTALPFLLSALPEDYFLRSPDSLSLAGHRIVPGIRLAVLLLKNLLGLIFLVMGFLMLFIPGQGLLTMLLGVTFLNFPGKRQLEIRLIRIPRIHRGVNWIRRRAGRPPVLLPPAG